MIHWETLTCLRQIPGERTWEIAVLRAVPDEKPRFCVQLLHDFSGRKERFEPLMTKIAQAGGIAVAEDLRGMGGSRLFSEGRGLRWDALNRLGWDGEFLLDDIDAVYASFGDLWGWEEAEESEPLPRILFGHGTGALAALFYAARRGKALDGLILSGVPEKRLPPPFAAARLSVLGFFLGDDAAPHRLHRSLRRRLNDRLAQSAASVHEGMPDAPTFDASLDASFNEFRWLSGNPAVRREYAEDPICALPRTIRDWRDALWLLRKVYKPATWEKPHRGTRVWLLTGEDDPVSGGKERTLELARFLSDMGWHAEPPNLYREARHELFSAVGAQAPADTVVKILRRAFARDGEEEEEGT